MTRAALVGLAMILLAALAGCGSKDAPPRRDSPKATVSTLIRAVNQRDSDQLKKCYAQQDAYVQGLAELLDASKQLQDEAAKEISGGREQAKNLLPAGGPNEGYAKFQQATEEKEPSGAMRLVAADGAVMHFVYQDGDWKIDDDGIRPAAARQKYGQLMHDLAQQVNEVTSAVKSGQYKGKDVKDIRENLDARVKPILARANVQW